MKNIIIAFACVIAAMASAQFKPTPYDTNSDAVARAFVVSQIGSQVAGSNYTTRAQIAGSNYVNTTQLSGSNYTTTAQIAGSNFLNAAQVGSQVSGSNYTTSAQIAGSNFLSSPQVAGSNYLSSSQVAGSNFISYVNATIFNIKTFGAVGNGVADDTLAVSNTVYSAGTNGGIVLMPQGTYKLTSTISITNNPIWILGEGGSTWIAPSGNFDTFRFSGNTRGCIVSGLFINGTNMTGGNVFTVTNSHRITFRDITGEVPFNVFSIESCNTCTIDNVWMDKVQGSYFIKWFGDDSNRSDILRLNYVLASGGTTNTDGFIWDGNCNSAEVNGLSLVTMNYGIHILKSSGSGTPAFLFAHDVEIDFPNREAVRIDSGSRFNFSDSYMHGSTLEYGVFATNGVNQVTIQGGNITGHNKGGILLQSTNSKVIGVEIFNNSQSGANGFPGILCTNGATVTIVGNRIFGANQQYGVRTEASTRPVVVGNDLTGNATGEFLDNGNTMITEYEDTQRPFFTDANTYLSSRANNISTLVVTANKLYMVPIWVTEIRAFTTEALGEVSLGASGNVRLGLYGGNRLTGHPTTLIVDAGLVSVLSTGTKTATASVTLNPGLYFLACVYNVTPTVHALNSDVLGVGMNAGVTAVSGLSRTFNFAALPSDESAQTYSTENGFVPALGIR